jgi:hypothetical protein
MATFEIHGAWLVELRDDEGRVVLTAAEHGHRMRALSWIASVRVAALLRRVEVRNGRTGMSYFVLQDAWQNVFAMSPLFADDRECRRMLDDLLHAIPTAAVVEVTASQQRPANTGSHSRATLDDLDAEVA